VLPLAVALREAGNHVRWVVAPEACELVAAYGFEVEAGGMPTAERRTAIEPRMAELISLPPRERRGIVFSTFFASAAAPRMRADLVDVFETFRPDVVVSELAELGSASLAHARGIPKVTVAFSGVLNDAVLAMTASALAPLWVEDGITGVDPEWLLGDLYLDPFPPSFSDPPAVVTSRRMRRAEPMPRSPEPDWLTRLGSDRPLVYLTSGTEPAAAQAPWQAALSALGTLDVDAVATLGGFVDPGQLGAIPENVRIERYVDQRYVLSRAAVVASHAGAGSMLAAAAAGLPQLFNPIGADQWENADAATAGGAAITCELDERDADHIAGCVARLIGEPRFAAAAARIAGELAAMPAPADQVATIEALAAG
jgi:UDP:flavonoid glycosyltransferase YjiC (YdhE family)